MDILVTGVGSVPNKPVLFLSIILPSFPPEYTDDNRKYPEAYCYPVNWRELKVSSINDTVPPKLPNLKSI
jgi:hypothetical protein